MKKTRGQKSRATVPLNSGNSAVGGLKLSFYSDPDPAQEGLNAGLMQIWVHQEKTMKPLTIQSCISSRQKSRV